MADNRKYYFLKLKENYFDDDAIVLLESMPDGMLYSNILLKMYLKSLKNGGRLQLDEHIPYTAQMIATLTRQQIGSMKDLQKWLNEYRHTRPVIDEGRKLSGRKLEKYRETHEADYIIYEAARRHLKESYPGNKLPNYKTLNAEIESLISEKNAAYNEYDAAKEQHRELSQIRDNARKIYQDRQRTPGKKKEHDYEL